jgi:catechol 2,3-dioxygenase-like lactoylglutathione lyase family enzyme
MAIAGNEAGMKAPFQLGTIGHLSLAVRNPRVSADWYVANLGMREAFEFEEGVAVESDGVTLVFTTGKPGPETVGHISFHIADMKTLRAALAFLKQNHVDMEDPGDEIGPEAPGSPHLALWLHHPDGYRLELSVQNGAREK